MVKFLVRLRENYFGLLQKNGRLVLFLSKNEEEICEIV